MVVSTFLKFVVPFTIIFFNFAIPSHGEDKCDVVPRYGQLSYYNDRLSPFWAQEITGEDLAYDLVSRDLHAELVKTAVLEPFCFNDLPQSKFTPSATYAQINGENESIETPIAQIYSGLDFCGSDGHGSILVNLLAGLPPIGIAATAMIDFVIDGEILLDQSDLASALATAKALSNRHIPLISTSNSHYSNSQELIDFINKQVIDEKTAFVMTSGNAYPLPADE